MVLGKDMMRIRRDVRICSGRFSIKLWRSFILLVIALKPLHWQSVENFISYRTYGVCPLTACTGITHMDLHKTVTGAQTFGRRQGSTDQTATPNNLLSECHSLFGFLGDDQSRAAASDYFSYCVVIIQSINQ